MKSKTLAQRIQKTDRLWARYIAASKVGHPSARLLRRRWQRQE